jgi:hypothetical protein
MAESKNTTMRKRLTPPVKSKWQEDEHLLPYQKLTIALAETRLRWGGAGHSHHIDVIDSLCRRAIALSDVVASGDARNTMDESLEAVMDIIREDVEVVKWLAGRMREPQESPVATDLA